MHPSVRGLVRRSGLLVLPVLVAVLVVPSMLVSGVSRTAAGASTNVLPNPGCENGTTSFRGYQARIESVPTARTGAASCRATSTGGVFYSLESSQSAANPAPGSVYTGSAWVRSDTAANRRVYLSLRERGGTAPARSLYGPAVVLTTQWQQVTSTITVQSGGRTALDFYLVQDPGSTGHSFYADDLSFQSGSTPDPGTTPTTTPPTTTVPPTTSAPTTTAPGPTTTAPTTTAPTTTAPTTTAPPTTTTPPAESSVSTLRVGPTGRYLVRADGSRFFWLGDTAWTIFAKLDRDQVLRYLDTRRAQGFTVVQATAIRLEAGANPYGDQPVASNVSNLLTTPGSDPADAAQYDYWDHVDFMVAEAEKRGMYVAMLPVWSHKQAGTVVTTSNAEGYGRFLGQRYAGRNIVWVFGGDDDTRHEGIWRAMAKGIAIGRTGGENYGTTLMTYHPIGNQSSSTTFHNDPWLDFNMVQSGHCLTDALSYTLVAPDYARTPTKPVIDGEPIYENHPICFQTSNGYSTPHHVRKFAYWSVFAGSFGHTYGHHSMWQFYSGSGGTSSPRAVWTDAITAPGAEQMRHLRALMESRPFQTGVPDQSIVASPGSGTARIQATRAADGAYLMVYAPDGQRFSANLTKLSGTGVRAHWFDPRTGTATAVSGVTRGSAVSFIPPSSGTGNDWVLVVDDLARGFARPGS